jgi:hypothetical protein
MLIIKTSPNCAENLLLVGLNKVQRQYLKQEYNRAALGHQRLEGVFSHELYHQLRKIQEDNFQDVIGCEDNVFKKIVINMTLPKQIYPIGNNHCIDNINTNRTIPDIVFHEGQNTVSKQMLVGEIKMKGVNFPLILTDFQKLIYYKVSNLNFENAVFIYTGLKSTLEEKLVIGLSTQMLGCLIKNNIVIALQEKQKNKSIWNIYEFKK